MEPLKAAYRGALRRFDPVWRTFGVVDHTAQNIFTWGLVLRVVLTIVGELMDAAGERKR